MRNILLALGGCMLLVTTQANACRPRYWSPKELARQAPMVLIAEITTKTSNISGGEIVSFRTMQSLKGQAPQEFVTDAGQIVGIGDGCTAITIPGWKRVLSVGEKWILIGDFRQTNKFVAATPSYIFDQRSKPSTSFVRELQLQIRRATAKRP